MYITNNVEIAKIAEAVGVDRIFVDMEYIGKAERQHGRNSVLNRHTIEDVKRIRECVVWAELLCRVNPMHHAGSGYMDSKKEIDGAIEAGADIIMLPYFKTVLEVEKFIELVNGRARSMLLLETPDAVKIVDAILDLPGIDEVFIGLNDLSLGYGQKFLFEPLADGTVERLCLKFKQKGIPFGFGGIASLGKGMLPSEFVIKEHYRLGSSGAILSRSFCNANITQDINEIKDIFAKGVADIRAFERICEEHSRFFTDSNLEMKKLVTQISDNMKE